MAVYVKGDEINTPPPQYVYLCISAIADVLGWNSDKWPVINFQITCSVNFMKNRLGLKFYGDDEARLHEDSSLPIQALLSSLPHYSNTDHAAIPVADVTRTSTKQVTSIRITGSENYEALFNDGTSESLSGFSRVYYKTMVL